MNTVQPIRDIDKIRGISKTLKERSARDYLMFRIGIYVGLRISDILQLKVIKVKNKDYLKLREKKTGKEKLIPIVPDLKKDISEYIEGMSEDQYLFTGRKNKHKPISRVQAYNILKKVANEFGLESIGTHTLRKTFGYHFYKKTKDIALLMEIFNHSDESITLRYIGVVQDTIDNSMKNFRY